MTYSIGPSDTTNEPATPASSWRRTRSGADDPHTSLLFWLTVLCLGCAALAAVTFGASSLLAQKGSEKLLRVDLILPKLISNHKVVPAHPKERLTTPKVTVVEAPAHPVSPMPTHEPPRLVETGFHTIPQVELTPTETCHDPVVYIQQCTPQRGDSPMMRTWKALTMYSLLSAATITFAPPSAVLAQDPPATVKDLDKLQKSITDLIDRIDKLEKKPVVDDKGFIAALRKEIKLLEDGPLEDISKSIRKLKSEQEQQKTLIDILSIQVAALEKKVVAGGPATAPAVDKAFMDEFRNSIKTLTETIAKLGPTEKRVMMSPPNGTAITTGGRVMLVNQYSDELLFIINGVGHRVEPNRSRLVENIPIGAVSVEVFSTRFGVFNRQSTTLAGGETFTLTANPR